MREPRRDPRGGRAAHGSDIPYFFDSTYPGQEPPARTPEQTALADRLLDWWTTFARTGTPGPDWPRVTHGGVLAIAGDRIGPVDVAREHQCGFWRSLHPDEY